MPLLRTHKRSKRPAEACHVGELFETIPRHLVGELVAEIALNLRNTERDISPESLTAFIDAERDTDPTISRKVRTIGECILRDLLIRQADALRSCNEALAATGMPELEVVKEKTEARLRDLAAAHRRFRHADL